MRLALSQDRQGNIILAYESTSYWLALEDLTNGEDSEELDDDVEELCSWAEEEYRAAFRERRSPLAKTTMEEWALEVIGDALQTAWEAFLEGRTEDARPMIPESLVKSASEEWLNEIARYLVRLGAQEELPDPREVPEGFGEHLFEWLKGLSSSSSENTVYEDARDEGIEEMKERAAQAVEARDEAVVRELSERHQDQLENAWSEWDEPIVLSNGSIIEDLYEVFRDPDLEEFHDQAPTPDPDPSYSASDLERDFVRYFGEEHLEELRSEYNALPPGDSASDGDDEEEDEDEEEEEEDEDEEEEDEDDDGDLTRSKVYNKLSSLYSLISSR
ncbi:MAG: hypothetical protein N2109_07270 [Fimbriimonadales bacterium]|nr:hypothetical protein [Fimbriimonadales bacterium]